MIESTLIASIYRNTPGTMRRKCQAVCDHLEIELLSHPHKLNAVSTITSIAKQTFRNNLDLFVFFHEVGHVILLHRKGFTMLQYRNNKAYHELIADIFATSVMTNIFGSQILFELDLCRLFSNENTIINR